MGDIIQLVCILYSNKEFTIYTQGLTLKKNILFPWHSLWDLDFIIYKNNFSNLMKFIKYPWFVYFEKKSRPIKNVFFFILERNMSECIMSLSRI